MVACMRGAGDAMVSQYMLMTHFLIGTVLDLPCTFILANHDIRLLYITSVEALHERKRLTNGAQHQAKI